MDEGQGLDYRNVGLLPTHLFYGDGDGMIKNGPDHIFRAGRRRKGAVVANETIFPGKKVGHIDGVTGKERQLWRHFRSSPSHTCQRVQSLIVATYLITEISNTTGAVLG